MAWRETAWDPGEDHILPSPAADQFREMALLYIDMLIDQKKAEDAWLKARGGKPLILTGLSAP